MPTPMDVFKMKVTAIKQALDARKPAEKKGFVSFSFAEEFNQLLDEGKKVDAALAPLLPDGIKIVDTGLGIRQAAHVDYLHIDSKLNQIIGAISLVEKEKKQ